MNYILILQCWFNPKLHICTIKWAKYAKLNIDVFLNILIQLNLLKEKNVKCLVFLQISQQ